MHIITFYKRRNMRRMFADKLHKQMKKNKDIYVIVGDLGYKMFDQIRDDFPDRFLNTGAAEVAMVDIAIGLALEGKIPFVYTATSFLLYRPFESIRNYIAKEKIPVKLVGSGRDRDYEQDGFMHWAEEARDVLKLFPNIYERWPESKEEIPEILEEMVNTPNPFFIS